jgi:hypothetical protein
MNVRNAPKDLYTRMVEFAFQVECPGATAHDRLKYLQDLMSHHNLAFTDRFKLVDSKD